VLPNSLPKGGEFFLSDLADTTKPTVNFGNATTLGVVSPSQTTYITVDLSAIPAGYRTTNAVLTSIP
jgi:hypothetical protein